MLGSAFFYRDFFYRGFFLGLVFIVVISFHGAWAGSALGQNQPKLTNTMKLAPAVADPVDEILDGFDDDLPSTSNDLGEPNKSSITDEPGNRSLSIKAYLELGSSYNISHSAPRAGQTDWRGLSSLYTEAMGEVSYTFSTDWKVKVSGRALFDTVYSLQGRDNYTPQVLDTQEKEAELMEAFILGSLTRNLDIKLGRQVLVWGSSDSIRVVDVLNPLDLRQPGLVDIEELRLPVAMTRMDYYWDQFSLTGVLVHEGRFNKEPPWGSDFYPYGVPLPEDKGPDTFLDHPEWALAANGRFEYWDLSLYLARIFNDKPHMVMSGNTPPFLDHARLTMAGASVSAAHGNFLFKAEAAFFDGLRYFNNPDQDFSRMDVMAGMEYTGFKETFISLESAIRHHTNWDPALENMPDYAIETELQTAFRISRTFLHERLTLVYLGMIWGKQFENGGFHRFESAYKISDSISLTGGLVFYQSGEKKIETRNIGDNDRIFIRIRYGF